MKTKPKIKTAFHFLDAQNGITAILNRRLKVARISELNDPFEFLGIELTTPSIRDGAKRMKKALDESMGVICFSESWQNPVMWSHYAENHKGICLGFDMSEANPNKIKYVKRRVKVPQKVDRDFIVRLLLTKYKHWVYEEEWRMFRDLESCDEIKKFYFTKFSEMEGVRLTHVIIGLRSTITRQAISRALGDMKDEVSVFQAGMSIREFKMTRRRPRVRK